MANSLALHQIQSQKQETSQKQGLFSRNKKLAERIDAEAVLQLSTYQLKTGLGTGQEFNPFLQWHSPSDDEQLSLVEKLANRNNTLKQDLRIAMNELDDLDSELRNYCEVIIAHLSPGGLLLQPLEGLPLGNDNPNGDCSEGLTLVQSLLGKSRPRANISQRQLLHLRLVAEDISSSLRRICSRIIDNYEVVAGQLQVNHAEICRKPPTQAQLTLAQQAFEVVKKLAIEKVFSSIKNDLSYDTKTIVLLLTKYALALNNPKLHFANIARAENLGIDRLYAALEVIVAVREKEEALQQPDFIVELVDGRPRINVVTAHYPTIDQKNIESHYGTQISNNVAYQRAIRFLESLAQRTATLQAIADQIAQRQSDYLSGNLHQLHPMTQQEVATAIKKHASTVSRAVANKTIATIHGNQKLAKLFLKSRLFTKYHAKFNPNKAKSFVKEYINNEDPIDPYTDKRLAEKIVSEHGLDIARTTVRKYRESQGILNHRHRKRQAKNCMKKASAPA